MTSSKTTVISFQNPKSEAPLKTSFIQSKIKTLSAIGERLSSQSRNHLSTAHHSEVAIGLWDNTSKLSKKCYMEWVSCLARYHYNKEDELLLPREFYPENKDGVTDDEVYFAKELSKYLTALYNRHGYDNIYRNSLLGQGLPQYAHNLIYSATLFRSVLKILHSFKSLPIQFNMDVYDYLLVCDDNIREYLRGNNINNVNMLLENEELKKWVEDKDYLPLVAVDGTNARSLFKGTGYRANAPFCSPILKDTKVYMSQLEDVLFAKTYVDYELILDSDILTKLYFALAIYSANTSPSKGLDIEQYLATPKAIKQYLRVTDLSDNCRNILFNLSVIDYLSVSVNTFFPVSIAYNQEQSRTGVLRDQLAQHYKGYSEKVNNFLPILSRIMKTCTVPLFDTRKWVEFANSYNYFKHHGLRASQLVVDGDNYNFTVRYIDPQTRRRPTLSVDSFNVPEIVKGFANDFPGSRLTDMLDKMIQVFPIQTPKWDQQSVPYVKLPILVDMSSCNRRRIKFNMDDVQQVQDYIAHVELGDITKVVIPILTTGYGSNEYLSLTNITDKSSESGHIQQTAIDVHDKRVMEFLLTLCFIGNDFDNKSDWISEFVKAFGKDIIKKCEEVCIHVSKYYYNLEQALRGSVDSSIIRGIKYDSTVYSANRKVYDLLSEGIKKLNSLEYSTSEEDILANKLLSEKSPLDLINLGLDSTEVL